LHNASELFTIASKTGCTFDRGWLRSGTQMHSAGSRVRVYTSSKSLVFSVAITTWSANAVISFAYR